MEYRKCTEEDIALIQEYQRKYVLSHEDPTMIEMKDALELLYTKIEGNQEAYRCACKDGNKVGYVHVIEEIDQSYLLDDLFVLEKYREKGIGTEILRDVVQNADDAVYVYMYIKNTRLIDFFEKRGFYVKRIVSKSRLILQHDHN